MYKTLNSSIILRLADNASIPADPANTDYAAYLRWLAEGNTPEPADTIDVKALKWEEIKIERDRRCDYGGYKVGAKWFHSDQRSRSQQLGLALLGNNIPANVMWKTMDGSFVAMTQTLAQQILGAAAQKDMANFAAAETHRAAMEASADPAYYDFSGGWPQVYGEP
jgi:hypothetical protein